MLRCRALYLVLVLYWFHISIVNTSVVNASMIIAIVRTDLTVDWCITDINGIYFVLTLWKTKDEERPINFFVN
jgi:hypothetical protein